MTNTNDSFAKVTGIHKQQLVNVYAGWPALLAMVVGWLWFVYSQGWRAGAFTFALSVSTCLVFYILRPYVWMRNLLAYLVFFSTPMLTMTGEIDILTGFGGSSSGMSWLGVSFVTASMAHAIHQNSLNPRMLMLSLLQPARWNSGPCAVHTSTASSSHFQAPLRSCIRLLANLRWIVLGAFFYSVLSSALGRLLVLKSSTQAADVLMFAFVFEAYVYFNFAGISFMVFGLLRIVGVPVFYNFNTPFAARDVIGYWQRWHMSLSAILKTLFFVPLKSKLGLPLTVLAVFLASALWHGVSLNFLGWGIFHGVCWYFCYQLGCRTGIARCLQAMLVVVAVVLGRLIFSESDVPFLLEKLSALFSLESWRAAPLWTGIHLDGHINLALCFVLVWLACEVSRWRYALRYRVLRKPLVSVCLLIAVVVSGTFGLGGVYGTR